MPRPHRPMPPRHDAGRPRPLTIYRGQRTADGFVVMVREGDLPERPLDLRLDLRGHSQTGPNWGYSGSGPAQLALALCADALGDDGLAQAVYQQFKFRVIAGIREDQWQLSDRAIQAFARTWQQEHGSTDRSPG